MAKLLGPSATMHEARRWAHTVSDRRLRRIERRLRRHHDRLSAAELTTWYATRAVLRERGVSVPPVERGVLP